MITGAPSFAESSLHIQYIMCNDVVHVLFYDLQKNSAFMRDQCNCMRVRAIFSIAFWGIGMKRDCFQSFCHNVVFQILQHKIVNYGIGSALSNSTGRPSMPEPFLDRSCFSACSTSTSSISGSRSDIQIYIKLYLVFLPHIRGTQDSLQYKNPIQKWKHKIILKQKTIKTMREIRHQWIRQNKSTFIKSASLSYQQLKTISYQQLKSIFSKRLYRKFCLQNKSST